MKSLCVYIILTFGLFVFESYGQSVKIDKITIQLAPEREFRSADSLIPFKYNYEQYGFYVEINDQIFINKFDSLINQLEAEKSYFMHVWIKIEIHYSNKKTNPFFMTYYRNGYYYKGEKLKYCPELNQMIYNKLIEKKRKNEIRYVGLSDYGAKNKNQIFYRIENINPIRDRIK